MIKDKCWAPTFKGHCEAVLGCIHIFWLSGPLELTGLRLQPSCLMVSLSMETHFGIMAQLANVQCECNTMCPVFYLSQFGV